MPPNRRAWVYILASRKNGTLYIGVTTDLLTRIWQHKTNAVEGFTKRHGIRDFVYLEGHSQIFTAIAREKALKGWTRARKIQLIESSNPDWNDLAAAWFSSAAMSPRATSLDPSRGSG